MIIQKNNKDKISGFGRWKTLTPPPYRYASHQVFDAVKSFCELFLNQDFKNTNLSFYQWLQYSHKGNVTYEDIDSGKDASACIKSYISKFYINPNDICILAGERFILREIETNFRPDKTMSSFSTYEDMEKALNQFSDKIRNLSKNDDFYREIYKICFDFLKFI